jgi:hypothetical protein
MNIQVHDTEFFFNYYGYSANRSFLAIHLSCFQISIYKSECMYVCMYACMFRHNYLSVIEFHFPLLRDGIKKSISREKCGILSKGPKYLRKYVCFSLAVARQRVYDSSADTNNQELLIARQRFRNHGYIDGNN